MKMNQEEKTNTVADVFNETQFNKSELESSNHDAPSRRRWIVIVGVVIALVASVAIFLFNRSSSKGSITGKPVPEPSGSIVPAPSSANASGSAPRPGDIVITLSPEKLENAHIKTEMAMAQINSTSANTGGGLRTTGTVEPNAYKEVPVLPVSGGIVREVKAQLGDQVKRGQALAVIFSTELSQAQSEYLNMLAEVEKHHQIHRRTSELVEIGAASRQELEEAIANYKAEQAKIAAAKQRLILLGLSEKQVDEIDSNHQVKPLITVESPSSGVILSRTVNSGEVVMQGKELFRVTDLSTVWVIGQIYESNFATVRVGTQAIITASAYPGHPFTGRVSYIDPRVEPQMRTAQVRVEVKNPGEMLKLGMFVDVDFGSAAPLAANGETKVSVPRTAVQMIGTKPVIFVNTDQTGIFAQREVIVGAEANGLIPIYMGLNAGEQVVTEGSFLLRAESLKLNPTQATTPTNQLAASTSGIANQNTTRVVSNESTPTNPSQDDSPKEQIVTVTLNASGYQPASFKLKQDLPARVTFVRKIEATCGTEIVIEEYGIKRELPLNEPVVVEFTPTKTGEFKFACGMGMLKGKIIVR
jgi:RND family efflux transporter MFP subunit